MGISDRERGIVLLLVGRRIWPVAAVCCRSLRRHWSGPVTLFCGDQDGLELANLLMPELKKSGSVQVHDITQALPLANRNDCYSAKPSVAAMSPYDETILLDVDTLVVGNFDRMWPSHITGDWDVVLTSFSNWRTNSSGIMRNRLLRWQRTHPTEVAMQLDASVPAINTGVVGFVTASDLIQNRWRDVTASHAGDFIADEMAMQMLVLDRKVRVNDDRYNRSPIYGVARDEPIIWHFHGKKHLRPEARPIWLPEYDEAVAENYAGIRDWTPAGDPRLAQYLNDRCSINQN